MTNSPLGVKDDLRGCNGAHTSTNSQMIHRITRSNRCTIRTCVIRWDRREIMQATVRGTPRLGCSASKIPHRKQQSSSSSDHHSTTMSENTHITQQLIQNQSRTLRILERINNATKWVVSALAFVILVGRRDEMTAWCIVGGVLSAFICRALKYGINASRPVTSRKKDPGMPSSHACTLGFLSVFASLAIFLKSAAFSLNNCVSILSIPALGLLLTSLRVLLGYHTVPQVVVGWMLGSSIAVVWHRLGVLVVMPVLESSVVVQMALAVVTVIVVVLFAVKNVMRWMKEERR